MADAPENSRVASSLGAGTSGGVGEAAAGTSDPRLDFCSPEFDPLLALSTPNLAIPYPNISVLDNTSRCRKLLPAEVDGSLQGRTIKRTSEEKKAKHKFIREAAIRGEEAIAVFAAKPREQATVSKLMAKLESGPYGVLSKAVKEQKRVSVVTRHARGIRGTATGSVRAFDRFLNLVLHDVCEEYAVLIKVRKEVIVHPEPAMADDFDLDLGVEEEPTIKVKWVNKQERRTRKLKQIFVRGDCVVLVKMAPAHS